MPPRSLLLAVLGALALAAPNAQAQAVATGGMAVPEPARLGSLACAKAWSCAAGQRMTVRGRGLDGVQALVFLGGRGRSDDRTARPRTATARKLTLIVPREARSGPVRAVTFAGEVRASRALEVRPARRVPFGHSANAEGVFPISGPHDMGQSATNAFGGGRDHGGQDMFADCGTPLVAVREARVQFAARQARAGYYVVLQDAAGRSYAYMHMRDRALVRRGDRLSAGEQVGYVGETGRATGCHLHFELWTAPGWYTGGRAVDPLPQLRAWEQGDGGHRR